MTTLPAPEPADLPLREGLPGGRPLRVLHLRTVRGTGGGPDKTVLKSCQYLRARGHQADAFYLFDRRHATDNLLDAARRLGVPLFAAYERFALSAGPVLLLDRVLREGRYDIVHTHEYKSNALVQLMRADHSLNVVATAHGYNSTTRREEAYYRLEQALLRGVQAVIVPTRDLGGFLRRRGVPPARLHVIPNAIEIPADYRRPDRGDPPGPLRLLYVGRLSAEKDPINLLQAARLLLARGAKLEVTLAGDGPERANVERAAGEWGLLPALCLLGHVSDVARAMANADILVSPSQTECMPNAVLEAMLAGLPVVATAVGGVGEMMCDGVHGLLCPPRDPGALAEAIARLADQPDLRRRLADNAYARVRAEYSFEVRMRRVLSLYERVIGSR